MYRESLDDIPLPKIPVQPISYGDAETLLRTLNHTNVPKDWQGGMGFSYGIEMDPNDTRNVTISVSLSLVKRAVCDVVGTIKGAIEPDRYVLFGSRRPSGGSAVIMEIARILLFIREKGWVPRRSIKICSWGAGEYGNIGIVEWIEEFEKILETRAVAYINADRVVQGKLVMTSSPLLMKTVLKVAKKVSTPQNNSQSLYDEWQKTKSDESLQQSGYV
ncbi:N-acetylated-alpha-linked acidic dipeptidase 2-like [Oculina patagonica]